VDLCDSAKGSGMGSCEHGIEHSGSIKCGEFLDWLSNYQLPISTLLHGDNRGKCEVWVLGNWSCHTAHWLSKLVHASMALIHKPKVNTGCFILFWNMIVDW